APRLADKAILPTAWGGRYFFNRIDPLLPFMVVMTGQMRTVIPRKSVRFFSCTYYPIFSPQSETLGF
ncbi:hypothetical protein ACSESK_31475, partial [Pseudomonas aeruginosa]